LRSSETEQQTRRFVEICNACRYCEGYCAVFPAIELRRQFSSGDLSYLANLCHDCRGCYYSCQYAPPHEFALNLPKVLAELRLETYERYAWPRPLAALFRRSGIAISILTFLSIAIFLWLAKPESPPALVSSGPGAFYAVIPEGLMVAITGIASLFALSSLAMGLVNFWRDTAGLPPPDAPSFFAALADLLTLRNLGGGGYGCNNEDESFSQSRRYFHHALFYGFFLCFASTCAAAVYEHILGRLSPYPLFSLPVLLGAAGGIAMLIGTAGLVRIKLAADPAPAAKALLDIDYAFLVLLFVAAATGLILLMLRNTGAMSALLAVHLGVIVALFLILPYCKFVHGIYRAAALLRFAAERPRRSARAPSVESSSGSV